MTFHKEVREKIEPLVRRECAKLKARRFFGANFGKRTYRGKPAWWVGYTWTRPYAHHLNGLVYEAPVAWGATLEEAIAKLEQKTK